MHQAALPPYIKDTLVIQHEAIRRRAVPRLKFWRVSLGGGGGGRGRTKCSACLSFTHAPRHATHLLHHLHVTLLLCPRLEPFQHIFHVRRELLTRRVARRDVLLLKVAQQVLLPLLPRSGNVDVGVRRRRGRCCRCGVRCGGRRGGRLPLLPLLLLPSLLLRGESVLHLRTQLRGVELNVLRRLLQDGVNGRERGPASSRCAVED